MTRHLALVGPTASGKSAVALEVARRAGDVEIVSLDSMQVYRGMDVGTAKPTARERAEVHHHLVDVADPGEEWSVARTQRMARDAIAGIEARGRRALLVGGTGLYVQAVVDGLAIPGGDEGIRARWWDATASPEGLADAYSRLAALDPAAAARIDPGNRRRVVRALEVIDTTGRPFSSSGPGLGRYGRPAIDVRLVGLWLPRAVLGARIAARVERMVAGGLVDEVRALAARPGGLSRTAAQAIGYAEVLAHVRGECPLPAALDLAVRRTRRFARRQRVWFRRDPRVVWIGDAGDAAAVADCVLACWSGTPRDRRVPAAGGTGAR
ncbi:MAG: tRNA dimethylallyltransferase [Acidimicrobiia bacterium]|nr:MAG: tRNA dimethylallyltransferase [Acidimicrobiia bacterium]